MKVEKLTLPEKIVFALGVGSIVVLAILGYITFLFGTYKSREMSYQDADMRELVLCQNGYAKVRHGSISSSPTVIDVSWDVFYELVEDKTVWRYDIWFYLFNTEMTLAWRYKSPRQFWVWPW